LTRKLWGGRFQERASASLDEFWSSISFDVRLFRQDIQGSLAHAAMLHRVGILSAQEHAQIDSGLREVLSDFEEGRAETSAADEDIHMNVERMLHAKIGAVAGKLHTARSRNDQVALDMHLFVRENCAVTAQLLHELQGALAALAGQHIETILPGYTHVQRAQPVLLAHHLLAYCWMFQRDIGRLRDCRERANVSPLGAGAIAGTTFPIDPADVARTLGFADHYRNSMDAVSDRDFVVELLAANALVAAHLSRLCEEVVLWSSSEFGFLALSDAFSSGSSMMPQKKNADLAELVRGKTGRVYGALITLLTVLKGLPLTYNKDFQEDKEALFDSVDTVQNSLLHLRGMMETITVNANAMRRAAEAGFLNATDLADHLAKRGVPFRESHEIAGKLVALALSRGRELGALTLDEMRSVHPGITEAVYEDLVLENVVGRRRSPGGTAPEQVRQQLAAMMEHRAGNQQWLASVLPQSA
jgi:argininosuccinate lyase